MDNFESISDNIISPFLMSEDRRVKFIICTANNRVRTLQMRRETTYRNRRFENNRRVGCRIRRCQFGWRDNRIAAGWRWRCCRLLIRWWRCRHLKYNSWLYRRYRSTCRLCWRWMRYWREYTTDRVIFCCKMIDIKSENENSDTYLFVLQLMESLSAVNIRVSTSAQQHSRQYQSHISAMRMMLANLATNCSAIDRRRQSVVFLRSKATTFHLPIPMKKTMIDKMKEKMPTSSSSNHSCSSRSTSRWSRFQTGGGVAAAVAAVPTVDVDDSLLPISRSRSLCWS